MIPKQWYDKLPEPDDKEKILIEELDDEVRSDGSRLGSQIKMTKELDGITVFIPDPLPTDFGW